MERIVAVVDSGIDEQYYHEHADLFAGVFSCAENEDGTCFVQAQAPEDLNGHGTKCVDMIHMLAPDCRYLVVGILNQNCLASTQALVAALEFLCGQEVDVIHMSLSVMREDIRSGEITRLCDVLQRQGKRIVCSVENRKETSFPANLPSVLGVSGGMFPDPAEYDYDPDRQIQFVCDLTPTLVSAHRGKRELFGGNSKGACIATAAVLHALQQSDEKREPDDSLLPVRKAPGLQRFYGGEMPCIRRNREVDLRKYAWSAADVLDDICELFGCDEEDIFRQRMLDACDEVSGEVFEMLFLRFSEREQTRLRAEHLHYVDFEWIWCLFEYIDREYKKERALR